MYENPFAIKPGESILTAQHLLERYLDWSIYADYLIKALALKTTCNEGLLRDDLCCKEHFQIRAERDAFFRYFRHLEIIEPKLDDMFLTHSMVEMIRKFDMEINEVIRKKLNKYWGPASFQFFKLLDHTP